MKPSTILLIFLLWTPLCLKADPPEDEATISPRPSTPHPINTGAFSDVDGRIIEDPALAERLKLQIPSAERRDTATPHPETGRFLDRGTGPASLDALNPYLPASLEDFAEAPELQQDGDRGRASTLELPEALDLGSPRDEERDEERLPIFVGFIPR